MSDEIKKDEVNENEEFANPLEKAIFENLTQNDDLVDYIHEDSLSRLMAKYSAAEEDENIREEWDDPAQTKNDMKKERTSKFTRYYYSPDELKKDSIPDMTPGLATSFDKAQSSFDSDSILFSDISLDKPESFDEPKPMFNKDLIESSELIDVIDVEPEDELMKEEPQPAPKRRGRPPKAKKEQDEPTEKPKKRGRPPKKKNYEEAEIQPTTEEPLNIDENKKPEPKKKPEIENAPEVEREGVYSISDKYYTNTKVVFTDDGLNDGIRRHSEDEVSDAFFNSKKKRRGIFGRRK